MTLIRPFNSEHIPLPSRLPKYTLPKDPIDLEIGCGVGLHPILYSKKNPNRTLVAIEHTKTKFAKFYRRYENHQSPPNIIPLHCNAISWVTHCLPEDRFFDHIYLLYPNPEPKVRNKRWYTLPFMEKLIQTLRPGGSITLATNISEYASEAKYFMTMIWGLTLISEKNLSNDDSPRTHFEKKYLERGQVCFDLIFQRPLT